jgi:hypothetical protein
LTRKEKAVQAMRRAGRRMGLGVCQGFLSGQCEKNWESQPSMEARPKIFSLEKRVVGHAVIRNSWNETFNIVTFRSQNQSDWLMMAGAALKAVEEEDESS